MFRPGNHDNKTVEELTACVIDYGTFLALADKLAETYKTVYYYCPIEKEFKSIADASIGEGLDGVKKIHDFLDPDIFNTIDLFIFPDIGYGGLQKYLRSIGKAVWGAMGADELELFRDLFLETLEKVKLPTPDSKVIYGLTALGKYLKVVKNKWVKINCFRGDMETWYHINYDYSIRTLESLAVIFGGVKEQITFVVQETINSEVEVGYDGWCIDGNYPSKSFQGYEKKNELYLGTVLSNDNLPEEIKYVNEKMSPVLKEYGYRSWWSTEIRVDKEGTPYFIDPTTRHPALCGEHQWETCANLAEIIWAGAHGDVIEPEFKFTFAASATLHYKSYEPMTDSRVILKEWKSLEVPKDVIRWFKPYHYCIVGEIYHFVPSKMDEVGVVIGVGSSIKESIDHLKKNLESMSKLPVWTNISDFPELIKSIITAEDKGIKFAKDIPDPKSLL
jgi:hypothetical protein